MAEMREVRAGMTKSFISIQIVSIGNGWKLE